MLVTGLCAGKNWEKLSLELDGSENDLILWFREGNSEHSGDQKAGTKQPRMRKVRKNYNARLAKLQLC